MKENLHELLGDKLAGFEVMPVPVALLATVAEADLLASLEESDEPARRAWQGWVETLEQQDLPPTVKETLAAVREQLSR